MANAISNTSPLVYLYRAGVLDWLPRLFDDVWIPRAVADELLAGLRKGYNVPDPTAYPWLRVVEPRSVPSEWLTLDLGPGELAAMALALDNPHLMVLLDDALARRIAQAAGLTVWGTLRVLLAGKRQGFVERLSPIISRLRNDGMWISDDLYRRVLILADEEP